MKQRYRVYRCYVDERGSVTSKQYFYDDVYKGKAFDIFKHCTLFDNDYVVIEVYTSRKDGSEWIRYKAMRYPPNKLKGAK